MADKATEQGIAALSALEDDELNRIVDSELSDMAEELEDPEIRQGSSGDPVLETPAPAAKPADKALETDEPESPPAAEEAIVEPAGTQAPPAPAADAAAAPTAPPAAISVAGATPFQFKASGGVHSLAGALELPDGSVLIPKAAQGTFRNVLASERELRVNFRNFQRASRQSDERSKKEVAAARADEQAVLQMFDGLSTKTEEELWEWCQEFKHKKPELERQLEIAKKDREIAELKEAQNPTPDPDDVKEARERIILNELKTTYEAVTALPEVKEYLTPGEVNAVFSKHAKRTDRLVRKGEKPGEEMFDDADVLEDLKVLIDIRKKQPKGPGAKERNDTRNADITKPTNVIPPVVQPRAPAGQNPRGKGQDSYRGKQRDFRKDFMAGNLDSDSDE